VEREAEGRRVAQEAAALKARLVDKFALQQVRHMDNPALYTQEPSTPGGAVALLCYVGNLSLCCVVMLTSLPMYGCMDVSGGGGGGGVQGPTAAPPPRAHRRQEDTA
jgi:hypothetical protein